MHSLPIAALVAGLALATSPACAALSTAVTAIDANGYGQNTNVNYVDGFRFRPNEDLYVQELGFFDANGNGLLRSYKVGIVAPDSTILGSVIVPAGTTARLDGPFDPTAPLLNSGFRYEPLAEQLHLVAGNTYALVALITRTTTDEIVYSPAISYNPAITVSGTGLGGFMDCRLAATGTGCSTTAPQISDLRYPTQYASGARFLNFTFTTTPVPLPAAAWLMLPAVAALGWTRRRA